MSDKSTHQQIDPNTINMKAMTIESLKELSVLDTNSIPAKVSNDARPSLRKKFLILESRDNVRELLSFYIESTLNLEALKCDNLSDASYLVSSQEIELIIRGECVQRENMAFLEDEFYGLLEDKKRKHIISFTVPDFTDESEGGGLKAMVDFIQQSFEIDPSFPKRDYTAISIDSLKYINGIGQSIFLELSPTKYVKVFNENDLLEEEDLEHYRKKGLKYLYLNKDTYVWILKAIEENLTKIISDPNYIISEEMSEVMGSMNLAPDDYEEILNQVDVVKASIMRNNKINVIKNIVISRENESYLNNKINLISIISCSIARELCWGSEEVYKKLIMAAHLHDVALLKKPDLIKIRRGTYLGILRKTLSEEDFYLYSNHTYLAGKLLRADPTIPHEVISIVESHHEKIDGNGFPLGLNYKRLKPFSCLFIVAIELAEYIIRDEKWKMEGFIKEAKEKYRGIVFLKILGTLSRIKTGR